MILNLKELQELASTPASKEKKSKVSTRSIVAENLDMIERARANGWPLRRIAETIGIECKDPGSRLSSYIASIKRAEKKKRAPTAPLAPSQRAGELPRPRLDVSQLPPPPGSRTAPETEWEKLKRETDARLKEQIAAIQAKSNQPKDVK